MTDKEYHKMTTDRHRMLLAAKMLPIGDALEYFRLFLMPHDVPKCATPELSDEQGEQWRTFQEMDKMQLTLDGLRALVREADQGEWWPTRETLSRHLHFKERRLDDWRGEDILQKILDTVTLIRALVFGDASVLGERDAVAARERTRFDKESITAAVMLVQDALEGEPQWDGLLSRDAGVALMREWLVQTIFSGRDVGASLESLHRYLIAPGSNGVGTDLLYTYCSYCIWRGWREGLEVPALAEDPFAKGCCQLLAGDLVGAHKLLFKFGDEGYHRDFAKNLLTHSVCMAVKPSITRATKIFNSYNCFRPSERYDADKMPQVASMMNAHADVNELWSKQWGANGSLVDTSSYHARPDTRRLDGVLRFAWYWHSKNHLERADMREETRRLLPFIAVVARNGYVNIGGLFLSLIPELGVEAEAVPILEAMKKNGTWILPYEEPKPVWSQFLTSLRDTLGVGIAKKVPPAEKASEEPVRGRVVWEVHGKVDADGFVELGTAVPFFREQQQDGTERGQVIHLEELSTEKYRTFVNVQDLALASKLLARESWDRVIAKDMANDLCKMSNWELVEGGCDDHPPKKTAITVESRPCTMSTTVTADGSTVLTLPAWRNGTGYAFVKTERPGVLAYVKLDQQTQQLIELFKAYGKDGKIVLPPDAAAVNGDVLEKLAEVLPTESREPVQKESLSEVKTKADCVVRLEFDEGCLNIHALTRPFKENAELLFEPGFGSEKRQVEGKGCSYVLVRNLAAERERFLPIRDALADFGTWFNGRSSWSISDVGEAIAALDRLQSMKPRPVLEWNKGKKLRISRPKIRITSGEGRRREWFAVKGKFTIDDGKVYDILELLNALRANGGAGEYVQLTSGEYVLLTREIRKQLGALAKVGREEDGKIRIPRGAMPFLASMFGGEGIPLPAVMAKAAEKVRAALAGEPEVPKTLAAQLRPYQLEGFRWLSRLASCGFGSCLADDMGLGKTLQTIALLLERAKDGASLVVAPASVCGNWRNEIRRFAPTLEPIVAMNEDEETIEKAGPRAVVIASYGYLLFHEALFRGMPWNGIVLDEAQAIKNADAKRTKLVKEFKANFRVAATGTPVENRLEELWSIFDFLDTGLLGTRESFLERGVASVKPIVKPLILRRLKGEVLDDLPQKTEVTRFVELSVTERSAYEACRLKAQNDFATADKKKRMGMLLAGLTRLRRFCCNPSLVLGKNIGSAKLEALAELMEELREGGHRALVFSQFTDYLAIVRRMVEEKGWSAQYLDGETPLKERGKRVNAFQDGEGDFFLISLKAGGTGLNLTAADYVIILDPWWNPAVENQAADRAHRIGQHRPVTIYRLIAKDTVEERVLDLHCEKLQLSADILDDTASAKLTSEQLLGLLK